MVCGLTSKLIRSITHANLPRPCFSFCRVFKLCKNDVLGYLNDFSDHIYSSTQIKFKFWTLKMSFTATARKTVVLNDRSLKKLVKFSLKLQYLYIHHRSREHCVLVWNIYWLASISTNRFHAITQIFSFLSIVKHQFNNLNECFFKLFYMVIYAVLEHV